MPEVNSYALYHGAAYPTEASVLNTAPAYGDPVNVLNGTLDPDVAANLPLPEDVRSGTQYGDDPILTGALDVDTESNSPPENSVLLGTVYGNTNQYTGNYVVVSEDNVRLTVAYGSLSSQTGTVRLPDVSDVRLNTVYDANDSLTGTLDPDIAANIPIVSDVRLGVEYGDDPVLTGTLDVDVAALPPDPSDVLDGVQYGSMNQYQGNVILPIVDDVRLDVQYGSLGSLTGAMFVLSPTYPTEDKVLNGINYGDQQVSYTGNYVGPLTTDVRLGVAYGSLSSLVGNVVLPQEAEVSNGVNYGADGVEYTGNLLFGGQPAETDVRKDVIYGPSNEFIGNVVLPVETTVLASIFYGANGTEYEGTFDPGGASVDLSGYNPFG